MSPLWWLGLYIRYEKLSMLQEVGDTQHPTMTDQEKVEPPSLTLFPTRDEHLIEET